MSIALLVAAHGALLCIYDLARFPAWTLGSLVVAFAAFFWAARLWEVRVAPARLLGIAVVLRCLVLPLPPTLSDDALRYVWDGRVVSAGFNPYALPPAADELAMLRDSLWTRMPHKDVPTVYPPLAMAVFTVASWLPGSLLGVKILLCFAELVGGWLLLKLAVALGLPAGRAVWYLWNPLAVLEVAGMGHVDGLMAAAAVAAVAGLVARRPARAGLAAAAGVLAKLLPLLALPLWMRHSCRPYLFLGVAGSLIAVFVLPVVWSVGGVPPGLVTYGVSWEFNGPVYEPLWRLYDSVGLDVSMKARLDRIKEGSEQHEFWNQFYPYLYPRLLAKLTLAALFGAVYVGLVIRGGPIIGSTGRLFGALALAMATFYPWYLLLILPWAALARHRAWLTLSATLQLAYVPQLTGVALFPWIWLAIWAPFWALLAVSSWSTD